MKNSLYDSYRLSNSTVVPMYQGSAAPEALQVGQYLQGLYDTAKGGANEVSTASNDLMGFNANDEALANEVRQKIQGDIGRMSESRDWENHVDDVRNLGRYYANRARELQAPFTQYQEWLKTLDEKELNLTPEQRQDLIDRSRTGYKGLQKDSMGRLVGKFEGVRAAKNIDTAKKVDDWLSKIAIDEGGTEITNDDGEWKIKKGDKWKVLDPKRIETLLKYAMANDTEYLAYRDMMGKNSAFRASRMVQDISQITDPTTKQNVVNYMAKGYNLQQAVGLAFDNLQQGQIENNMKAYAITKYRKDDHETVRETSIGDLAKERKKEENDMGVFGDLVTDRGMDLAGKYGDVDGIEKSFAAATQGLDQATTAVNQTRQNVARDLKKNVNDITDADITGWFNNHPAEQGAYKANLAAIQGHTRTIGEINALKDDAMNLAVKTKNPGMTGGYKQLREQATTSFQNEVLGGAKLVPFKDGTTITKANAKDFEVVDGDATWGQGSENYIKVRNKSTGKEYTIYTTRKDMAGGVVSGSLKKVGDLFDGINWKNTWKDAASNLRSNTMVMPLLNKTTPDGHLTKSGAYASRVSGILSAGSGGLSITDADFNKMDSKDAQKYRTLIGAKKFDLIGITKGGSDGKLYAKVSIEVDKDADDPNDRYKTIFVAADSNMANKMGQYAQEAGVKYGDIRTYQFGKAMMPGSGYEQVLDLGPNGRLLIKDRPLVPTQKDTKPLYEVVTNMTGDPAAAVSYEVYKLDDKGSRVSTAQTFNDAFDLGTFIDELKGKGAITEKNNKR